MNKVIGICLILLALGSVAEEPAESVKPPRVHEYKLIDGKMIRQGPLKLRYLRIPATPEQIEKMKGNPGSGIELIVTDHCPKYQKGKGWVPGNCGENTPPVTDHCTTYKPGIGWFPGKCDKAPLCSKPTPPEYALEILSLNHCTTYEKGKGWSPGKCGNTPPCRNWRAPKAEDQVIVTEKEPIIITGHHPRDSRGRRIYVPYGVMAASPEEIEQRNKAEAIAMKDGEIIITAACRWPPRIRRVGFSHPNKKKFIPRSAY